MFIVEGNIGAGKTTFLKLVQQRLPELAVVFEPVQNWQQLQHGQSILAKFYEDPHRWAYTMETVAMTCRAREHLKEQENPNPYRLMERSIYSGHYVFANNGYKNGFMTEVEWRVYLEFFKFVIAGRCKEPQGFIYLKTDPEVAYTRIKKRDRSAEKTISFEYIQQIHERHEEYLIARAGLMPELAKVPVLVLDCNEEFEANSAQFIEHARKIASFVNIKPTLNITLGEHPHASLEHL